MHTLARTVLLFVLAASLASCKKEEESPPSSHPSITLNDPNDAHELSDFSLLTVGNYWIYERQTYDSTGVPMGSSHMDSIFFASDTVINGHAYVVQRRASGGGTGSIPVQCLRDSADCLVNEYGRILFRYGVFDQVAWSYEIPDALHFDYLVFSDPVHQVVPAGDIVCYRMITTVTMIDEDLPPVPPARYPYYYWSPGIGKVKQMEPYVSNGWMVVHELLRYNVE